MVEEREMEFMCVLNKTLTETPVSAVIGFLNVIINAHKYFPWNPLKSDDIVVVVRDLQEISFNYETTQGL